MLLPPSLPHSQSPSPRPSSPSSIQKKRGYGQIPPPKQVLHALERLWRPFRHTSRPRTVSSSGFIGTPARLPSSLLGKLPHKKKALNVFHELEPWQVLTFPVSTFLIFNILRIILLGPSEPDAPSISPEPPVSDKPREQVHPGGESQAAQNTPATLRPVDQSMSAPPRPERPQQTQRPQTPGPQEGPGPSAKDVEEQPDAKAHGDWWPSLYPTPVSNWARDARKVRQEQLQRASQQFHEASQRAAGEDEPASTVIRPPRAQLAATHTSDAGESSEPSRRRVETRWPLLENPDEVDAEEEGEDQERAASCERIFFLGPPAHASALRADAISTAVAGCAVSPLSSLCVQIGQRMSGEQRQSWEQLPPQDRPLMHLPAEEHVRRGQIVSRRPGHVHPSPSLNGMVSSQYAPVHYRTATPTNNGGDTWHDDGPSLRRSPRTTRRSCRLSHYNHDEEEHVDAVPSPGEESILSWHDDGPMLQRRNALRRRSGNGHGDERVDAAPSPMGFFAPTARAPHHALPESPMPLLTDPVDVDSEGGG